LGLEVGLIVLAVTIAVIPHVLHGTAIAFLEAIPEFAAITFVDGRMLVYVMIVGVGVATVHVVATGSFHAFMEALALGIAIAVGCAVPIAIPVVIAVLILSSAGNWLCFMRDGLYRSGRCNAESEGRN